MGDGRWRASRRRRPIDEGGPSRPSGGRATAGERDLDGVSRENERHDHHTLRALTREDYDVEQRGDVAAVARLQQRSVENSSDAVNYDETEEVHLASFTVLRAPLAKRPSPMAHTNDARKDADPTGDEISQMENDAICR